MDTDNRAVMARGKEGGSQMEVGKGGEMETSAIV